jgi:hypothetical protein
MKKVYVVSEFPAERDPDGIYYKRPTRQISVRIGDVDNIFDSIHLPDAIDAFTIAGYYPLYKTEDLAKSNSPLDTATAYGETELGPAPAWITYPVYMPNGLNTRYLGDHDDHGGGGGGGSPAPSATSIQWFEEDSNGDLILRSASFESTSPAIQYWENSGADDIMPRDSAYSSTTEDAQYFEVDGNGDIIPVS